MRIIILSTLLLSLAALAENSEDPSGLWNTFGNDGNLKSSVSVRVDNNQLFGTIKKLYNTTESNPMCLKCEGDLKGKPVLGMQVINGLALNDDVWQKGTILDPESGNTYKGKVWIDGGALHVRGYIGFVYQTQIWQRATNTL
ncbi:MAG: DUF2147 domain-containing protein [Porticoccaceae bacterium]|nr:DUF2147 domain-containing protein [Porticoccaceae bacterium]